MKAVGRVTAVVIDDHAAVRDGVRSWFRAARPPIALIDAGDRIAVAWHPPGRDADVVVLDLHLGAMSSTGTVGTPGFAELRRLADSGRRVVVYTHDTSRDTVRRAMHAGACAVVTKSGDKEHLVDAVREAGSGRPRATTESTGSIHDDDPTRPRLAPMELAALRAWFSASSKTLAARSLNISPKTLDTYIGRVRVKYAGAGRAAPTKSALVQRALDDGLVTLDELRPGEEGAPP